MQAFAHCLEWVVLAGVVLASLWVVCTSLCKSADEAADDH